MKYVKSALLLSSFLSIEIAQSAEFEIIPGVAGAKTKSTFSESTAATPTQSATIDSPACFTIVNETDQGMPIALSFHINDKNKGIKKEIDLKRIERFVGPLSTLTIKQSECVLWKWAVEAFKHAQPANCYINASISFNIPFPTQSNFHKCTALSLDMLNVKNPPPFGNGETYRIVPVTYDNSMKEKVNSFEIMVDDTTM